MNIFELLDEARLLIDFGMLVLIWLVQLIIYPSFQYCDAVHFKSWHYRYTGLISLFVAPLMLSQTAVYAISSIFLGRWHDFLGAGLMVILWGSTFGLSVPCHDLLQKSGHDPKVIHRLVSTNWIRTAAWSTLVGVDLIVGVGVKMS